MHRPGRVTGLARPSGPQGEKAERGSAGWWSRRIIQDHRLVYAPPRRFAPCSGLRMTKAQGLTLITSAGNWQLQAGRQRPSTVPFRLSRRTVSKA
ncbi:MAG: hypothetical protein EOQ33_23285 [Mesorhizobium sp.]|nr:MAG: hypothetical protein EOQ33_23285 [Mesorhizobium sp.]